MMMRFHATRELKKKTKIKKNVYVTYVPVSPVTAGENGRKRPQGKRQKEKKKREEGKTPISSTRTPSTSRCTGGQARHRAQQYKKVSLCLNMQNRPRTTAPDEANAFT